ncbi:phosphopantetheine-binding protein [Actinomadura napierensis]|uniref:Carrier domain-containing protein n=1 Tax=Actinomadura napierensis TaxID=267854 RepID=A0ABP5K6I8_9ACTN
MSVSEVDSAVLQALSEIWEEVLEVDGVTADDDFFELGGDSLLGVTMIGKARHAGLSFSYQDLKDNPVLGRLAAVVAG